MGSSRSGASTPRGSPRSGRPSTCRSRRRSTLRRRVGPLRRTTEQIVSAGDTALRIRPEGRDDIAALGRSIDAMLDMLAGRDVQGVVAAMDRIAAAIGGIDSSITDARTVAARQSDTVAGLTAEVRRAADQVAALA